MANTTIALRQSGATGNTPSLGIIANGEIALNYADGILYYKTAANALGSIRTTQPAGLTTEIQFNDAGAFGSNSGLTFSKATGTFTAPIVASTNNGNGTNFKVGDDIWIGDVNVADTLRLTGQQNVNNAYIIFGASDSKKLGRSGTGALTYDGNFSSNGEISSLQSSGDEGGQFNLALAATNQSLSGSVAIDIYQNKFRIYETGGTNRGVYIDMANSAATGVGTDLTAPVAVDSYARSKANSANITADAAYAWANTVNIKTDAAFTKANTANVTGEAAFAKANTANITAEAAFSKANSSNVLAQAAFDKANQTAQLAFTTVAANGTNLVADANNDTLTITANTANGIEILSNATTDTLDLGLKSSGATAGTYGNSSTAITITVDRFGRITSVSQTAITYAETDPNALAFAIALG